MRDTSGVGSLVELLRCRATEQSRQVAFTWLGTHSDEGITYAQLDLRAKAVGAILQQAGPPGERALLVFPPGLDFIAALFGCLYAGWIAVPAYPPPLNQRLERIEAIVRDAQPRVALTSPAILQRIHARTHEEPASGGLNLSRNRGASRPPRVARLPGPGDTVAGDTLVRLSGYASEVSSSFYEARNGAAQRRASSSEGRRSAYDQLRWLALDAESLDAESNAWLAPGLSPDNLAVLQYTSGSTASPRGVMLTHANLLHNVARIQQRFEAGPHSQGVIWLPPYHDMGLVGGILEGVYAGFPIALMAPVAFLQRPRRWLEAITRTRATISGGPNFAYDLCVERIPESERDGLDLSSWKVAFNGSEPVRADTLDRFSEAFKPHGFRRTAFYPCYGLAEATLMVSGGAASTPPVVMQLEDGRRVVGCGSAIDDQRIAIVDGEVWVAGPSVATGYWRQPALTEEVFGARLPASDGAYLRTGDLGFIADNELFITGRSKATLIIGGRKIQAEDIEACLDDNQPVGRPGSTLAVSVDIDGKERLFVVREVHSAADFEAISTTIRRRVAEVHQLSVAGVVLTRRGGMPRTSSGKIRRAACRAAVQTSAIPKLYEWRAPWL